MNVGCESCKFFFTDRYRDGGFCRRYPPIAAQDGDNALWPWVRAEWACGEYIERPWHPSNSEPDRNAPGYATVLHIANLSRKEGKKK